MLASIAMPQSVYAFDQDHMSFARVLTQSVKTNGASSEVHYAALKKSPGDLSKYLAEVESASKAEFDSMSKNDRLAFLINAYNALTLKLVVDHYPVKSIKDIGGHFGNPWKNQFFSLLGERHSLDDVEHKMIRPVFHEPRIHFALVCASRGCPRLYDKPFVGSSLEKQLDDAQRTFLGDSSKNQYLSAENTFSVSSIFKWYGEDFEQKFGSVKNFLATQMVMQAPPLKESIEKAKLNFKDYDWSLNEARDESGI